MFHLDPLTHTIFNPELFQPEMALPTGKKTPRPCCPVIYFAFAFFFNSIFANSVF